jgi:hypothetical protein
MRKKHFEGMFWLLLASMLMGGGSAWSLEAQPAAEAWEGRPAALLKQYNDLTQKGVLEVLGKPNRKARQLLYRRCLEQWIYDAPVALVIEFAGIPGRSNPRVLSVQKLRIPGA